MQTEPHPLSQLSTNAQVLLDRLNRQFTTALFDITAAAELIERGYAARSSGGLRLTEAGMMHSQTS